MSNPLNSSNAQKEIEKLRTEIERHNRLYYIEASPEISDREFDTLLRHLENLEKQFPELATPDSPTQRVGGEPLEGFVSVKHKTPMLSLQNADAKKPAQLSNFVNDTLNELGHLSTTFFLEPKIDGISISLRYENGILVQALTRGDGEWGDDVTTNIKTIRSIPLRLIGTSPEVLEIRGEVYMTTSGFAKFNEERQQNGEEAFANPRNACAGTMKQLDPKEVAKRPLDALFYGTGALEGIDFDTHEELIKSLSKMGLATCPKYWVCSNLEEIQERLEELDNIREKFDFAIDGCVIKLNQRSYYEKLGYRTKSPKWAIAYKYEPEQAKTTLLDITVQVGRTGVLTPVAELEPVQLAGTTVKRATLHNEDEIRRKKIMIGDTVIIKKAGEIIPAIIKPLIGLRDGSERYFEMPKVCPDCGEPVEKHEGEVALRCVNLQCPAQLKTWLSHFASRGALDIEGLGGVVADSIVDHDMISSPLDLFDLEEKDLAKLNLGTAKDPRTFGKKNAAKVFQALEKSKTKPLGKWIFALGIPKVGKICAEHLASLYTNLEEIKNSEFIPLRIKLMELLEYSQFIAPRNKSNNPIEPRIKRLEVDKQIKQLRSNDHLTPAKLANLEKLRAEYLKLEKPECARRKKLKTETGTEIKVIKKKLKEGEIDCEILSGPAAKSIANFVSAEQGWNLCVQVERLRDASVAQTIIGSSLQNSIFVLTGTLLTLKREDASDLIKLHGGKVSSSISKKTTYLLAGENAGSKLTRAQELGITILDEEKFLKLVGPVDVPKKQEPLGQLGLGI